MTTPVFVIHGIGGRDLQSFSAQAEDLGRRAGFTAHPVYWGDLGARSAFVRLTIPGGADEIRGDAGPDDIVQAIAFSLATEQDRQDEIRDASLPPEALEAALAALDDRSDIRDEPGPD